jgi:galactofuranose transport system substrate-binding protein
MNAPAKLSIIAFCMFALITAISCDRAETGAGATGGGGGGERIVVGFSQVGAESAWRTANTQSIQEEAKTRDVDLRFADGQQNQDNQIKSIQNFITQGVDVIAFAPVVKTGWDPVLREAKSAGIPVFISDRRIDTADPSLYVCFVGADFRQEGRMAAEYMAKVTNSKAVIAELEGTPGSDPAIQRKEGFHLAIKQHPEMRVIKSQTGEFTRARGREVMEAFLPSPEGKQINALFAHNDDMALGAIQAIEAAGLKPGQDIIIVSIDAVRGAFEAMTQGKLNGTVECNPLLGPALFDLIERHRGGEELPKEQIIPPTLFTPANAAEVLPTRKY